MSSQISQEWPQEMLSILFAVLPLIPYVQPYLAHLGDAPERLIANFHTGFNLALVAVFLPVLALVDRAARMIAPDRPASDDPGSPRYLDEGALDTPSVALTGATREALRMGDAVKSMLTSAGDVLRANDANLRKTVEAQDDVVDRLKDATVQAAWRGGCRRAAHGRRRS